MDMLHIVYLAEAFLVGRSGRHVERDRSGARMSCVLSSWVCRTGVRSAPRLLGVEEMKET